MSSDKSKQQETTSEPTAKAGALQGGVGGHIALTDERVAEEARSEQRAHGGGVVPKGSLAARMQSANDRYDNAQQQRAEEEKAGPMGRGVVGGAAVAARPEDAAPDVCPPPKDA